MRKKLSKENTLRYTRTIRFDERSKSYQEEQARLHNISVSEWIRWMISPPDSYVARKSPLRKLPPSQANKECSMCLAHLGKIGSNVNQIAKKANIDGNITEFEATKAFTSLKVELNLIKTILLNLMKKR